MLSCQSILLCPMEVRICMWYKNRNTHCKSIDSGIITMTMVEMALYHSFHGLLVSSQVLWPGIKLWCQLVSLWRLFQIITWQFTCIPSWTFGQKWAQHNWCGGEPKPFPFLARGRDIQAAIACGWIMALLPCGVISRREMGTFSVRWLYLAHRLGWGLILLRGVRTISQWSIFGDYSSSVISAPSIICRHPISWSLFKCNCHYKSHIWHQCGNLGSMPTNNCETPKLVSRTDQRPCNNINNRGGLEEN